jgi:hypothetical protein
LAEACNCTGLKSISPPQVNHLMQLASKLVLSRIQQPLLTNTARELARAQELLSDAQRNHNTTLKYMNIYLNREMFLSGGERVKLLLYIYICQTLHRTLYMYDLVVILPLPFFLTDATIKARI